MKQQLRRAVVTEFVVVMACTFLWASHLSWKSDPAPAQEMEQGCQVELQRLKNLADAVRRVVEPLDSRLPDQRQIPRLLAELSRTATECGFELEMLTPGNVRHDSGADTCAIELSFKQPYARVARYARALEALPYIFGYESIVVSAPEGDHPEAGVPLSVSISLMVFLSGR
ncbi:MAG: type 4a pilus biogenesis protein PilO [Candidatus Wallbacteria bacterium]|nr:type 4a pilus biogenesis protein PilO [Candidatus Wallbacteria bacterium]